MAANRFLNSFILGLFFVCLTFSQLYAEAAFDFGLPLFGHEEVRFEKTKTPDFNFQLLKKYLNEHQGSILHQLHAITRWFSLIKLSDTPRQAELSRLSQSFFDTGRAKEISKEERLREVFFNGLLLSKEKEMDESNSDDENFEDLLLKSEKLLADSAEYFIIKGIVFHYLRNRPNNYFSPMKPEEDLKKSLLLIPRTAHYYYVLGQAFRLLGNDESSLFLAIASYEKSAALDPRNPKLQNSLLSIYMGLHEDFQSRNKTEPFWLEEAVYKKILTMSPNNPYALNNLGYLYSEYGVNTDMAQELCQKAVDLSPDNPGFRDSLGWAAFKNRDYRKAEEELKKSLSMRNNVYDPHYHLATLYYATGELNKAEEYYRQAIKFKPDSAEALNNLAYLLAEQNRQLDEATSMAEKAVKIDQNNASYLDTLGWLYYRAGKLPQALSLLQKSAQIAPGQGEILMHIGVVYLDMGEFATALDYLKQAQKADPNLKETESALYLALRLKGYFSSLSEYHSLYRENANKDRICHILTGIARLYQEEKQYEKAIDYTRIAADIRSGARSLSEPLFKFYSLPQSEKEKKSAAKQLPEASIEEDISPPVTSLEELPDETEASSDEEENEELETIPDNPGFPLVISFGPDSFILARQLFPTLDQVEGISMTLFIKTLLKPGKGMILRLESETQTGTGMLQLLSDFFRQLSAKVEETENSDIVYIRLGHKRFFAVAESNSVYLFPKKAPTTAFVESLAKICPHYSNTLASIFFDWEETRKQIPEFIKPFVSNPMSPFIRCVSRYGYKNGVFNEFSLLTTGKAEDNSFMQKFARQLFAFKIQTGEMGLESTIKVRGEKDIIFLLVEVEGLDKFIETRFPPMVKQLANILLNRFFAAHRCFISRMFYYPLCKNCCPAGGTVEISPFTGMLDCSIHKNEPVVPIFLDESTACKFRRMQLEELVRSSKKAASTKNFNENLLNELVKEYNLFTCPTSGTWQIDKNGNINCSDHEN